MCAAPGSLSSGASPYAAVTTQGDICALARVRERRGGVARSGAGEDGVALLEGRPGALGGVVRGHDLAAMSHLDGERLVLGHGLGLAQRGQDALDRERAVAGDAISDLTRLGE